MNKSNNKMLFSGIIWVATYLLCLLTVKEFSPAKWLGVAISLIPVVTFAFFIYHFIKKIRYMDEVERNIQLEATVWGFSLGLLMLMTLGALDLVVTLNKKDWGYLPLITYFVLFYFIGLLISRRKYL